MIPQPGAVFAALLLAVASMAQEPSNTNAAQAPEAANPASAAPSVAAPAAPSAAAPADALPPVQAPDVPPARKSSAGPQPPPPAGDKSKLYVIGALDVVFVKVWGNANLTGAYNVGEDGLMYMPLVGAIKADGLTQPQLTQTIKDKLNEYFEDPADVNVELAKNNSHWFYIMGEGALRPGRFPLDGPTTVSEALAVAGGFSTFANLKKIYVLRGQKKFPFNYKDVIAGKHLDQDIQLENGDKIVIPQ